MVPFSDAGAAVLQSSVDLRHPTPHGANAVVFYCIFGFTYRTACILSTLGLGKILEEEENHQCKYNSANDYSE